MTRITEAEMTLPSGLECDVCHYREMDPLGGIEKIMVRSSWAQSMSFRDKHICEPCYRGLEPMAREGYWHRQITSSRTRVSRRAGRT